jgi:hypothetical protein
MSTFLWIVGILSVSGGYLVRRHCTGSVQSDLIEEIESAERHQPVMDPSYAQLVRARAEDEYWANVMTRRWATWCLVLGTVALVAATATTFITL